MKSLPGAEGRGTVAKSQLENRSIGRKRRLALKGTAALAVAAIGGSWLLSCATPPQHRAPVAQRQQGDQQVLAFDMNHRGRPDYWEYVASDGRVDALAFPDASGQPGAPVALDAMDPASIPHFVILLDGVPFEAVAEARRDGLFRLFYAPSKVICCFPAMTDLALADVMQCGRCQSLQALSFDRSTNHTCGGNSAYLSAANAPWAAKVNFRASPWWDGLMYLDPQKVFNHELQEMGKCFEKIQTGEAYGYSVGTAGLGTRYGRDGMSKYLSELDAFCQQIVYERRGRVRITLTADHGHGLVEDKLVSFKDVLKAGGYHDSDSLDDPHAVVTISYGLVTYAEFFTKDAPGVARCLLNHESVDFTCYADAGNVVVCNRDGSACVSKGPGGGFKYECSTSDPFKLAPILQRLAHAGKMARDGEIDEAALFEATVDHEYPDPLARVWRAFHGLVQNQPDVIANLRDGFCHGSQFFYDAIGGHVASTHGAMNRRSSTTFVMSMLGNLPPVLRSQEILPALASLRQPAASAASKR